MPGPVDDDPAKDWGDEATVDVARETTGRHRLTPAQFAGAVELAENDGYRRGLEHGRAEGRADVRADDWEDGKECALRGLHVYLMACGFAADYSAAFVDAVRPFIRRGG